MLDAQQLADVVREAQRSGNGDGRTVIADVAFERRGDCASSADRSRCIVAVRGSEPPITLLNATTSSLCPPTWYCTFQPQPAVPVDGPFAVTIRHDGAVDWVGWVATSPQGQAVWSFEAFRAHLGALDSSRLDAYKLYAVPGWVSATRLIVDCFGPPPSPRDPGYEPCEDWPPYVWFTAAEPIMSRFLAPEHAVRLQSRAYSIGRVTDFGPQAVYLVRPHFPCALCDAQTVPSAELLGRLGSLTPSPTPAAATMSPAAAAARAIVQRFEVARIEGDWPTAWALLGQWTRSFFGSIDRFARSEAASDAEGNTVYQIDDPVQDPAFLKPSVLGPAAWSELDQATAWYVAIHLTAVGGEPTSFEDVVVATGADGQLHIWIIH